MQCFTPQETPVEILGAERVHPKLAGITAKMITANNAEDDRPCEYQKLKRVIFDGNDNPAGATGCYLHGDLTINVRECFETGVVVCDGKEDSGIMGMAWHAMLETIFHELFHVWVDSDSRLEFDDTELEDEEADRFAFNQMVHFAMQWDVEIPPWDELGLLTDLMREFLERKFEEDAGSKWLATQRRYVQEGIVFVTKEDVELPSYREFIRVISGWPLRNEDRWDKPGLVTWENAAENITPDAPPKPEAVFTAANAGVPQPPPTTAANAATAVPTPPSAPTPPTPPAPTATAVPTPPAPPTVGNSAAPLVPDGPEIVYDEDSPPEPDMSEYEEHPYHAYAPIEPPREETLTNGNIPLDEMVASMQAVYVRLAHVMFDKCQFNGGGQFANPAGVLDPVNIADIKHANELVHSCETLNQFGQQTRVDCNGSVKGTVFAKKGLPAFILYLNINGKLHKRTLVAQNPNTGSKSARDAQRGVKIVWVINADMSDQEMRQLQAAGKRASKFIAKIQNGQYITLN